MISWVLLVSLICVSGQVSSGPGDAVLPCGPQNLVLTSFGQVMMSSWEDTNVCFAVTETIIYELKVFIANRLVHQDELIVARDQIGSTHYWNWTSPWIFDCVSHSLRLSSRYKNHKGSQHLEQTLPGKESSRRPQVYPRDRVFQANSIGNFCCVLPPGHTFDSLSVGGYTGTNNDTVSIDNRTFFSSIRLTRPTVVGVNIICRATNQQGAVVQNGASAFIGYPPGDKDLQCETRDLQSVECHWNAGRDTHLRQKTKYKLLGSECKATAASQSRKCSQKDDISVGEKNWTLTAQNDLGTVDLFDQVDLRQRVHLFAPEEVRLLTINSRNVSLTWSWPVEHYNDLNITCQVNISDGGTSFLMETSDIGVNSAAVTELVPNWTYNVMVRCGTTEHFWKWSPWSSAITFHTETDVPDALDVWMQMRENKVIVHWKKPLDHQSHGLILNYTVTWRAMTEAAEENVITVPDTEDRVVLSVDTAHQYLITAKARNANGSSSPSIITTPAVHTDQTRLKTSRITGVNGGFHLSWSVSPVASCGYILDWCPTLGDGPFEWLKVTPQETEARIISGYLRDGLRYSLSISACTPAAPVLLERREGYVREEKLPDNLFAHHKWKQQDMSVVVSWDPVRLTEQSAFINGYVLYWSNQDSNVVYNVSTDHPEATSLTASDLKIGSYQFTVKAQTAVGESGSTSFTVSLNSPTDALVKMTTICLVSIFIALLLITLICCRHGARIKNKVCPPIPKPVVTDKWLTSQIFVLTIQANCP
ncbi:leukemia inhibitory factor receptor-like isoform X2 [Cynoglossus semilaevis]|uniref:leukemia inhibitory factor receptor-like isoform X2 n=1 Tax=Cynoglossus semilaevis TaxID=244447 RepID=UPI000D62EA0B|nr:leukemia inhibitory factor receptor-like isoform X2 [Cynoglossus semilaevis]